MYRAIWENLHVRNNEFSKEHSVPPYLFMPSIISFQMFCDFQCIGLAHI
jgi:hypothetical protein